MLLRPPRLLLLTVCALLATCGTAQARRLKQQLPIFSFGGAALLAAPTPAPAALPTEAPTALPAPAPDTDTDTVVHGGNTSFAGNQCLDSFKAWLQTVSTCSGTTAECCATLLSLGESCWGEILDSSAGDEQLTQATISLFEGCGLTVTPVNPSPAAPGPSAPLDEQQCIDAFNTALNTTCTTAGDDMEGCCTSLSALGADCHAYLATTMAATPEYTQLLEAFIGTLDSCGIPLPGNGTATPAPPSSSSPAPIPGGSCIPSFQAALSSSCGGTDLAPCCAALYNVGDSCLEEVANSITDEQTWEAFVTLMEGCGYSLSTRSQLGHRSLNPADADAAAALQGATSLRSASLAQPQPCQLCGQQVQLQHAAPARLARRSALVTSPQFRSVKPALLKQLTGRL